MRTKMREHHPEVAFKISNVKFPKRENDKATTSAKHIQEENLQIRN